MNNKYEIQDINLSFNQDNILNIISIKEQLLTDKKFVTFLTENNSVKKTDNYEEIIHDYIIDEDEIYLPLVEYNENKIFNYFLNTSAYKPYGTDRIGLFYKEYFLQNPFDTTLLGSIIPTKYLKKYFESRDENYINEINYGHFVLIDLMLFLFNDNDICGIQKVLVRLDNFNYKMEELDNSEKNKIYKTILTKNDLIKENK